MLCIKTGCWNYCLSMAQTGGQTCCMTFKPPAVTCSNTLSSAGMGCSGRASCSWQLSVRSSKIYSCLNFIHINHYSQMMSVAIATSDPESCLVIPDLSRHELQRFYENAFRGLAENDSSCVKRVVSTLAVEGLFLRDEERLNNNDDYDMEEDEEEEDSVPEIFGCLKKSDKIKLSQYFGHGSENDISSDKHSEIDLQLNQFRQNYFQCKQCSRKFSESSQLEKHNNIVHVKKEKLSDAYKPYKCPHCDRRFAFNCNVGRHILLMHNIAINKISHEIPKNPITSNSKLEKLEDIKCKVCNEYFPNWKRLQLHMFDHTSERPFNCEECGRGFKEESKLRRHSLIHSGLKPFSCKFCNKVFSLKQNKDIHERLHTGSGFPCSYCKEIFSQKVNLRKHESKHETMKHVKTSNSKVKEHQTSFGSRKRAI